MSAHPSHRSNSSTPINPWFRAFIGSIIVLGFIILCLVLLLMKKSEDLHFQKERAENAETESSKKGAELFLLKKKETVLEADGSDFYKISDVKEFRKIMDSSVPSITAQGLLSFVPNKVGEKVFHVVDTVGVINASGYYAAPGLPVLRAYVLFNPIKLTSEVMIASEMYDKVSFPPGAKLVTTISDTHTTITRVTNKEFEDALREYRKTHK